MRGPAKLASYLATVMVVNGLGLVGLGWYSAAGLDHLQEQFPYLLSSELGGLGLIVTGIAVLLIQTVREQSARERAQLNDLHVAILRVLLAVPVKRD
jgi:hypothetical protein